MRRDFASRAGLIAGLVVLACVDSLAPGAHDPATAHVQVTLPAATPAVWSAMGETLHVTLRRAGRVEPIAETTFVISGAIETTFEVPMAHEVERFVASAEVRYRGTLLFLGFDAVQLRAAQDTTLTLATSYVGPGAAAASLELLAPDTTMLPSDTARLIRVVRDTSGQVIPNVPARFVAARPTVIAVDTAGLLTAQDVAPDTARVVAYLPMGQSSALLVSVVAPPPPPPPPPVVITSVVVSPASQSITTPGGVAGFSAEAFDADGASVPSASFTWTSSDESVATVNQNGVATAVANGTTQITATADGVSGSATLTVNVVVPPPPPTAPVTRTWVGGDAAGARDWSVAANWSPAGVPAASDSVVIDDTDHPPVLTAPVTVTRLRITADSLTLNGQHLTVTGDFSTEVGQGSLTMISPRDTLSVRGNALFMGAFSVLDSGVFLLGGHFEQRNTVDNTVAFQARGTHRTVFDGAAQQRLSVEGDVQFAHLEIANGGGVLGALEPSIEIEGTFRISTPVAFQGGDISLDIEDTLALVAGSTLNTFRVRLSGDMAVAGTLDVSLMVFNGAGKAIQPGLPYRDVEVEDSVHLAGATTASGFLRIIHNGNLVMNGQKLTVGTFDLGGPAEQGLREARLTMTSGADSLVVDGDATFDSDTSGAMTAGVIVVGGHARIARARSLRAGAGLRLVLAGAAAQTLAAANGTQLGSLEIRNAAGPVAIGPTSGEGTELRVLHKLAVRTPIAVSADFVAFDVADSVITPPGSTVAIGSLIMRAGMRLEGAVSIVSAEFAGSDQAIPAGVAYQNVNVSGQARLVASLSIPGSLLIRGEGANLDLNDLRFSTRSFTIGGVGVETGTLTMTQPGDSLVVAEDAVFAGASTAGLLTNGWLVVGGGLFTGSNAAAFQASGQHRTVLNGAGQQILSIDPAATQSRFNHLELSNGGGGFWLRSSIAVAGMLTTQAPAQVISGDSHHLVSAGGIDLTRLTFDSVALAIGAGNITRLDSVTFARQSRTGSQLSITHPGATSRFLFTRLRFLTAPTTGAYVNASDVADDGRTLTIDLANTAPADGSSATTTSGGAVVNWLGDVFTPAANTMAQGRFSHGSTVLADGRVLVAAGKPFTNNTVNTSSDVFFPATNRFVRRGDLQPRHDFAIVTLADGRALVVGGDNSDVPVRTSETYDPVSFSFTLRDTLGANGTCQGRISPTATLLADGRVLVAGGRGRTFGTTNQCWPVISQLFDPATNLFVETGVMANSRYRHTATLLADGRVLIAGGDDVSLLGTATAEIYNPVSGTFAATGSMGTPRVIHTATPLGDGRVLVTGGIDNASSVLATAEIYNPATGTFAPTGSMGSARMGASAVLLSDGRVMVIGGRTLGGALRTSEIYDPATGTFSPGPTMAQARYYATAHLLGDGRVVVIGGLDEFGTGFNTAEIFTP